MNMAYNSLWDLVNKFIYIDLYANSFGVKYPQVWETIGFLYDRFRISDGSPDRWFQDIQFFTMVEFKL